MLTPETLRTLEETTKHSARQVLENILDGNVPNQAQESISLRFISASAKYLNHVRSMQMMLNNPSFGTRPVRTEPVRAY